MYSFVSLKPTDVRTKLANRNKISRKWYLQCHRHSVNKTAAQCNVYYILKLYVCNLALIKSWKHGLILKQKLKCYLSMVFSGNVTYLFDVNGLSGRESFWNFFVPIRFVCDPKCWTVLLCGPAIFGFTIIQMIRMTCTSFINCRKCISHYISRNIMGVTKYPN